MVTAGRSFLMGLVIPMAACGGGPTNGPPASAVPASEPSSAAPYRIFVTNESSGDLTVIDGGTNRVAATIPLGKRPRGIKVSPDRTRLYVALSGSPLAPPGIDESTLPPADKKADGIGVVDITALKVITVLQGGSDPEQVAVTGDGSRLVVANEDTGLASLLDIASGKILSTFPVGGEPEGVTMSPDGRTVYVTSEEDSQVSVIDTSNSKVLKQFDVGPRPRASESHRTRARVCHLRKRFRRVGGRHEDAHVIRRSPDRRRTCGRGRCGGS